MKSRLVVSDASPLIALERIDRLDLVPVLFGEVVIPPAVRREIGSSIAGVMGITEHRLSRSIDLRIVAATLDEGESEAISLALELGADEVVLDDEPARRLARSIGLPVIGTVGLLLRAKHQALIPAIKPIVDALIDAGFHLDQALYRAILIDAGEI